MARFVLVHGAFGGAWSWERVVPGLRDAGHEVEAIDLPGHGDDPTPVAGVTLDAYARRICEQLAEGPPALLTGHSMGGMAITQAAARTPERVAALVYVAAWLPWDGMSLLDLSHEPEAAGDQVQANITISGDPPVAELSAEAAVTALSQCTDPELAAAVAARRIPQPVAPFAEKFTLGDGGDAFAALPRAYVTCLQDQAVKPAMQKRMYTTAGCNPVIEIDTDHAPAWSATAELVAALDRIAGELT